MMTSQVVARPRGSFILKASFLVVITLAVDTNAFYPDYDWPTYDFPEFEPRDEFRQMNPYQTPPPFDTTPNGNNYRDSLTQNDHPSSKAPKPTGLTKAVLDEIATAKLKINKFRSAYSAYYRILKDFTRKVLIFIKPSAPDVLFNNITAVTKILPPKNRQWAYYDVSSIKHLVLLTSTTALEYYEGIEGCHYIRSDKISTDWLAEQRKLYDLMAKSLMDFYVLLSHKSMLSLKSFYKTRNWSMNEDLPDTLRSLVAALKCK